MKNNDVYVVDTKIYKYSNDNIFNPSTVYPEGLNIDIKSDSNIYDCVRRLFIQMGLDKGNIGKKNWNPFGDFIKKNNKVVIKPNLVKHINESLDGNTDSLITNFSVIRPIIDYTIIALNGTGSIIVGDAPVQECNFAEVIKLYNLEEAIKKYNDFNYKVELKDFRKNSNPKIECTVVDIGENSSLVETDEYYKKYAITNYNLKYMHSHHCQGKHEYLIAKDILDADVIINVPKPKCHRKAGITASMKNFVGVNSKKEYLPHHRNGSVASHGDEYPESSFIKYCRSVAKNYSYTHSKIIYLINGVFYKLMVLTHKERFQEGSWYGNDTIWRTILDINKILLYSDKNGVLSNNKKRIIFNVADMIISGEKEGPLIPSNKEVGLIVASFNQLNMDRSICKIMGFEPKKIKYINEGYKLKKFKISSLMEYKFIDQNGISSEEKYSKNFIPTDGWIDYLTTNDKKNNTKRRKKK